VLGSDVPPWNAKIADLGFAKNFAQAGLSGMTMTGQIAGTVAYMPREQVTNFKYVKPVSDVWSMGATFYHMLTGALPREMHLFQDPIEAILHNPVVPIEQRDPGIPLSIAEVINRALSNDPAMRYQDAQEFRAALEMA
jgi:serine/threonine protein kinase